MIWSQKPDLEKLNQFCQNTMCESLGIRFTEAGDNYLLATMPVDQRTKQPMGLLHGGASVALAETLGSVASALCVQDSSKMAVGIEINANHLKSARSGLVTGKVTAIKLGRNLHVWATEIHNEAQDLICICRLTVMIVDKK